MQAHEIEALFRNMESDRVERKRSTVDQEKICEAICAFANDLPNYQKPGVIFVGQRDDGTCANIQIGDHTLREIGGWKSDGRIQPIPSMVVQKMNIDNCEVAVVVVEPSNYPPVRFDGRTWIRVGPRRATASFDEETRLAERRRHRALPFDMRPTDETSLDDLDLSLFENQYLRFAVAPETLQGNHRAPIDQLKALRLASAEGRPSVAAILFFAKDPQAFLPGAYIQALRVSGTELHGDNIKSERPLLGTLPDQIAQTEELFRVWNERRPIVGGPKREELVDYPEAALRQLLRNALLHRSYEGTNAPVRVTWYDDRVEISSPGGLFGRVTPENFGSPDAVDYRNPTIAEAFKTMGFVDKFGVGVGIARRTCRENGNPEPEFSFFPTYVHVTIRKRP